MKENKNNIAMTILVMVNIITIFFVFQIFLTKPTDKLPEVKLQNIKSSKSFAIMVKNGNNYEEYKSDNNEWPGDNYEFKEAKCIDNNGSVVEGAISFLSNTNKVTLTTNKTVSCTLYFDKKPDPKIAELRKNDPNNRLSSKVVGGMYRFQGSNTEVINNYICFGTNVKQECINESTGYGKYMYRIIGITEEGQLYIIKMKGVEEQSTKKFVWNAQNSLSDCEGNVCEWPNSDLYKRINGISNGITSSSNGNTNIFVNNPIYDYMVEENDWYNKIESHNWMYGDIDDSISSTILDDETVYGAQNNGLILYDIETGIKPTQHYEQINGEWKKVKYLWSAEKSVPAKIGLMYLHDYYLAYDNERNWYSDYDTTNWLLFKNNYDTTSNWQEWLISRYGANPDVGYHTWYGDLRGYVKNYLVHDTMAVRPTFYLISSTKIKSGTGSIDDPYILEV